MELAEKKSEPYWYIDYVGFEQKQSRTNKLIVGLRHWSREGTKRKQLLLDQNVKIPTRLIHRNNKKSLTKIAESWRDNPEMNKHKMTVYLSEYDSAHIESLKKKYPGLDIQIRRGNFDVFQIDAPYNRKIIKGFGKDFQNGNYDRNFRFENDLLHRKVSLNALQQMETFFSGGEEKEIDSLNAIQLSSERLKASEFRDQVWFYADIEKPLFKSHQEKTDLDRRDYFLGLKLGKEKKFRKKLEQLVTERKSKEEVSAQVGRIINRLEDRLTKEIGGNQVKLWEERYDAKISWYTFILKKADGSEMRQLHTIRDCGLEEINGYQIVLHKNEKDLLNKVIGIMKENNVSVFCNHNLPYDITQTRFAAEETGADSFDLFIDNLFPRRDVVRKAYQRMKKDIEYFDTYRAAAIFHPWLESKKLESFAKDRLGEEAFKKSLNYAQMRELEVKAINGDKEAAKLLANYASSDVEPVKKIVEKESYLETIFKIREMFPFLTITETAFSPRSVKKYFDWKHWQKNKNNRHFEYNRKKREHEEQIFKKRFGPLKREYLRDWAFEFSNMKGIHKDVLQAYIPLEQWLKDIICDIEPKWREYYSSLSQNPVERFGQLRYPRAFSNEFLMDHYFAVNDEKRYQRKLGTLEINKAEVGRMLDEFGKNSDEETLNKYLASLNILRNQYRGLYVRLDSDSRKIVRVPKSFSGESNLSFDFVDFFANDNNDIISLREHSGEIRKRIPESQIGQLKRFLTNFETYKAKSWELSKYAPKGIHGMNQENFIYMYALREGSRKRADKFKYEYRVAIDEVTDDLKRGYASLRDEILERKTQIVSHKGDYLFLKGGDLTNLRNLIPVRRHSSLDIGLKREAQISEDLFQ